MRSHFFCLGMMRSAMRPKDGQATPQQRLRLGRKPLPYQRHPEQPFGLRDAPVVTRVGLAADACGLPQERHRRPGTVGEVLRPDAVERLGEVGRVIGEQFAAKVQSLSGPAQPLGGLPGIPEPLPEAGLGKRNITLPQRPDRPALPSVYTSSKPDILSRKRLLTVEERNALPRLRELHERP